MNQLEEVQSERRGSRWLHAHPSEEEVRDWFATQPLHLNMVHDRYLSGIVLIGAKEKAQRTLRRADGGTYVREDEQQVFVPYVKVDTRIAYFWDYVRVLNGGKEFGDFYGSIKPVPQKRVEDEKSAYFNMHLPEGYSVYPVRENEQKVSRFLIATYQVSIMRRMAGDAEQVVLRGQGSKQTATKRQWADDNAIMKAETGAIGRALGVAGMLVIGTGVATAEDMQEALAARPGESAATMAALPADAPAILEPQLPREAGPEPITADDVSEKLPETDEELRKLAVDLNAEMKAHYPVAWEQYIEWWNGRGFGELRELSGPALKGAVIKLQRDLDTRRRAKSDATQAE